MEVSGYISASAGSTPTEKSSFFHIRTVHLDTIKVFYLPTDAQ